MTPNWSRDWVIACFGWRIKTFPKVEMLWTDYWAPRQGNNQLRNTFHLRRKRRTKMADGTPKGLACPIHFSVEPIFAGSGRVISGRLVKRFESRFGTNTKLLHGVIGPISTPNDYLLR